MRTLIYLIILSIIWSSLGFSQESSTKGSALKQGAFNTSAVSAIDASLYSICMKWSDKSKIKLTMRHSQCINGVKEFNNSMDIEFFSMEKSAVAVIFRQDLLRLLAQPKTVAFLKQLVQDLDNVSAMQIPNLTLKNRLEQWYPKQEERFSILAILFQDTSPLVAHIYWLNEHQRQLNSAQMESLQTFTKIAEQWQEEPLRKFHLQGLPGYHSYVPAYLASLLAAKNVPAWTNFSMSYGFNYFYEYLSLRHEHVSKSTYVTRSKYRQHVNVNDVYPAYVSVLTTLGRSDLIYAAEDFQTSFQTANLHPAIVRKLAYPTAK
ncbi:MAG: hypothetical protein B7Y39_01745 [Bdellovibrio sp. 28-41-41]|nr:MAG: hypothetical protein B7Y39_01745 [Bdellovibrio sp. 28-41-41]